MMINPKSYGITYLTCTERNKVDELYDEKEYQNQKIEKMSNSELIEAIIELRTEASKNKSKIEFYFLDNKEEMNKYKKLFKRKKDFILELAKQDVKDWLEELPLYNALIDEATERELSNYLDIIFERNEVK